MLAVDKGSDMTFIHQRDVAFYTHYKLLINCIFTGLKIKIRACVFKKNHEAILHRWVVSY